MIKKGANAYQQSRLGLDKKEKYLELGLELYEGNALVANHVFDSLTQFHQARAEIMVQHHLEYTHHSMAGSKQLKHFQSKNEKNQLHMVQIKVKA